MAASYLDLNVLNKKVVCVMFCYNRWTDATKHNTQLQRKRFYSSDWCHNFAFRRLADKQKRTEPLSDFYSVLCAGDACNLP